MPEYIIKLIWGSYKQVTTKIKHGMVEMPLQIRHEDKQGHPISPLAIYLTP
jgi:hypothetical protein